MLTVGDRLGPSGDQTIEPSHVVDHLINGVKTLPEGSQSLLNQRHEGGINRERAEPAILLCDLSPSQVRQGVKVTAQRSEIFDALIQFKGSLSDSGKVFCVREYVAVLVDILGLAVTLDGGSPQLHSYPFGLKLVCSEGYYLLQNGKIRWRGCCAPSRLQRGFGSFQIDSARGFCRTDSAKPDLQLIDFLFNLRCHPVKIGFGKDRLPCCNSQLGVGKIPTLVRLGLFDIRYIRLSLQASEFRGGKLAAERFEIQRDFQLRFICRIGRRFEGLSEPANVGLITFERVSRLLASAGSLDFQILSPNGFAKGIGLKEGKRRAVRKALPALAFISELVQACFGRVDLNQRG